MNSSSIFSPLMKKLGLLSLVLMANAATAGPVVFSFTGIIGNTVDPNPYGVALGDSYVLSVRVNNGSIDLTDSAWEFADILDAVFSAGSYSSTWDNGDTSWFAPAQSPLFATDAAGTVTTANFQGSSSSTGTDNEGASAYLFQDGVRSSLGLRFYGDDYYQSEAWTVALDRPLRSVPSPAPLVLLGLGLAAIGWKRRNLA